MVPLFQLHKQHSALESELQQAFQRVLTSGHFILGQEVADFEKACAAYLGVPFALGVSSGTDALLLALMACGIGPGDEVLVPSFTFFATAGCVTRVGATPVFVDSCPVCCNISPSDFAAKITDKTRAVIPVHLYGQAACMDVILGLANIHGLRVIEDAAQAIGARYQGKLVGTLGDFGAYSFFPTKNLGALGDAGLLVCNDPMLAERARILRVHGMEPKYHHAQIGGNFRIDALQAAFLQVKLPYLEGWSEARRRNAEYYLKHLADCERPKGEAESTGAGVVEKPAAEESDPWEKNMVKPSPPISLAEEPEAPAPPPLQEPASPWAPFSKITPPPMPLFGKSASRPPLPAPKPLTAKPLSRPPLPPVPPVVSKPASRPPLPVPTPVAAPAKLSLRRKVPAPVGGEAAAAGGQTGCATRTESCRCLQAMSENAPAHLPESTRWIILPEQLPDRTHIWNQFTIRVPGGRREELKAHLDARGIGSEIYYPLPLHEQACFSHVPCTPSTLEVSAQLAREVLSLPIYPELSESQLAEVVAAIREWVKS